MLINLSEEDKTLLREMCEKNGLQYEKVIQLLETIRDFEFKDRRVGIYDALLTIIKTDFD